VKVQKLILQFRSEKVRLRAWRALELLHEVGVLPKALGFAWSTDRPRQITLYTGSAPS
jgi:hypothetical protein